ncbi:MAG: hypothetical protein A3J87_06595 [Sideroxydans sp. RIFOXYB12_FULL_59_6]|nr:MAG: hypothetical protein A3J87_06595 [Sideroxydans sp. RIFOXYB12_FULL_59_6]
MPWNLLWWPAVAANLATRKMNQPLLDALPVEKPVVVLSHGFQHIIQPILQAAGLSEAVLIASLTGPNFENLRVSGKLAALKKYAPDCDLQNTLFITDSNDDDAVAQAVQKSHVVEWCSSVAPAFDGYYLPMRYTVEGKYANRRYFTYQIVQEDFALLLLAYSFSGSYAVSLWFLFLSLYAIYEIGYYENDHVAVTRETKPVVSDAARKFTSHPRFKPWIWAFVLGFIGITFAMGQFPLAMPLLCWSAILVGVYITFFVFNHLSPKKRVLIFPLLHILKTFSFILFIPLTLMGALLLAAQVAAISANYVIYRFGGNLERFNRQAWRLILFLALAGILLVAVPHYTSETSLVRFSLIIVWSLIRTVERARHKNIVRIIKDRVRENRPA